MTQRIAILGGGISGLSTAHYLANPALTSHSTSSLNHPLKIHLFESSPRLGGWIRTLQRRPPTTSSSSSSSSSSNNHHHSHIFELGPRSIRPAQTPAGMNTLDLVETLGLSSLIRTVHRDHPAAKRRLILKNGKLVPLPTNWKVLFRKEEPLEAPLIVAGLRDLLRPRKRLQDDSLYNFVKRRFGNDVADYIVDPVVRGITAGSATELSVKFLLPTLFKHEQKYGSALLGLLVSPIFERGSSASSTDSSSSTTTPTNVGYTSTALASLHQHWAMWTFQDGLETLPYALSQSLESKENVSISTNAKVTSINKFGPGRPFTLTFLQNDTDEQTLEFDHLISTLPFSTLGKLLSKGGVKEELLNKLTHETRVNVQVTNLMWDRDNVLKEEAFGFLVPSKEKPFSGFLGVAFDSAVFSEGNNGKTVLTVMSRKEGGGSQHTLEEILQFLRSTVKIQSSPDDYHDALLQSCIPQYTVGHYERVESLRNLVTSQRLPLTFAGASVDGVSVNDTIWSGRLAAERILQSSFE